MFYSDNKKNANKRGGDFDFVPKEARGCMTDEELEETLQSMNLSAAEEKVVREVCRKGFVIAPELNEHDGDVTLVPFDEAEDDEEEYDIDKCLADGKYNAVALNAFYGVVNSGRLLYPAIARVHRLERLTSLQCPDIITMNEARIAREKIGVILDALDAADEELRKLQLKTDSRTAEKRLLDAVFAGDDGDKRKGGKRIVYVASAYRGNVATNIERAKRYSRFVASKGCVPFTPHLLYTQFLDDAIPDERRQGLSFGTAILAKCDALWAFGGVSEGMKSEIETAKRLGKPIKYFNAKCEEVVI